jgi:hypothetical protein
MLAAISAVFDTEESSDRLRRKSLMRLGDELATYICQKRHAVAVILCAGTRLAFALPNTPRFEYLAALKGSLLVGTYDFSSVQREHWEAETRRAIADLDAAITDYWVGRYSSPPGAPD